RRYVPVLKNFPTEYIHEPWIAPLEVQQQAKCVIGRNYPLPMVNHAEASRRNFERLRQVYRSLPRPGDSTVTGPSCMPSVSVAFPTSAGSNTRAAISTATETTSCTSVSGIGSSYSAGCDVTW
ncbi:unnamed protein product, partial [Cyprideis torosa]